VPIRWVGEKEAKQVLKLIKIENDAQKNSYSAEELSDAYETYLDNREKQLQDLQVRADGSRRGTLCSDPVGGCRLPVALCG
jgi:hypothetical protein